MNLHNLLTGSILAALVAGGPLEAQVAVKVAPHGDGQVLVTLTNTSDGEISFLRYNTPLDGMEANLFQVRRDGRSIPYRGKLALRLGPTEQDWTTLAGQESISVAVDIADAYAMDDPGVYNVSFRYPVGVRTGHPGRAINGDDAEHGFNAEEVESNVVDVFVNQVRSETRMDPATQEQLRYPLATRGFSGCTTTQQSSINTSSTKGKSLSANAYNYLVGVAVANRPTDPKYRTWYGAYTSSRYSTVADNFYRIYNSFNRTWNYTCTSCSSGVVAYVYPNNAYNVWICAYFHQFGTTEKGSFLLHEASHWTTVAATDDYGYGSTFCKNLASTKPDQAIYNADSYRFFSLN